MNNLAMLESPAKIKHNDDSVSCSMAKYLSHFLIEKLALSSASNLSHKDKQDILEKVAKRFALDD